MTIEIRLPPDFDLEEDDTTQCAVLKRHLSAQVETLRANFDLEPGDRDPTAQVYDFAIDGVSPTAADGEFEVTLRVGWEVYASCRDIHKTWFEFETVAAAVEERALFIEEPYRLPERQAPNEEF